MLDTIDGLHATTITSIAFSADGTLLATAGDDKYVHVLRVPVAGTLAVVKQPSWISLQYTLSHDAVVYYRAGRN